MDSVIDSALIEAEKEHVATAQKRAGEKAKSNPARKRLEFDFAKQPESKQGGPHLRFIRPAYPPCNTALDNLEPIGIADLRLEMHHVGKILYVTTFGHPQRTGPIVNAVEDQHGKCQRLALYNYDHSLATAQVLPKDTLFAIKEPFFELPKKDDPLIRIDHPSNLVKISNSQRQALKGFKDTNAAESRDALQYKDEGNAAFKNKDYLRAVELYTDALRTCKDEDSSLRSIALRNRAIVNIHLQRYELAVQDALASLDGGADLDEKTKKSNATACFRAGRAEYQLGNFEAARKQYQRVLDLTPKDADAERELQRTEVRLKEQDSGEYDVQAMSKVVTPKQNRLDHASFFGNVEVRESSKHGNGLFAVRSIKAGDLVFCEKALSVAFDSDSNVQQHLIHNLNSGSTVTGPQITLQVNLVQKMRYNRSLAQQYLQCYDGGYEPKCKAELVDGVTAVDAFQTMAIIEGNAFACPTTRSSDLVGKSAEELQLGSVGFWVKAAYMNSACDGNARRAFIGDMMMVRATRDIAQGEEILAPYVIADADNAVTQQQYEKIWGFTCKCHICTLEAETPTEQRKERRAAIAEAKSFFENNSPASPTKASITRAEQLYEKTMKTYDETTFKDSPRLGLVDLGIWLCRAYHTTNAPKKLTSAAEGVLQNLGFVLQIDGQSLSTKREFCHVEGSAIEAAMRTAHACRGQGKKKLGDEFERLGRELYVTLHGEARGFKANYNASEED